jgi:hypothetical protein
MQRSTLFSSRETIWFPVIYIFCQEKNLYCEFVTLKSLFCKPIIESCFLIGDFTDKKENQIFLIFKEIQSGAVAKSYMRKGFLTYEEMPKYFPMSPGPYMMRPLVIYDFATTPFWIPYI